ncbi:DsbE family thiol:disulfide interchange protein [Aestuariicella sp. G3-2]|uniref:DsbE family thiol:disulfide interchange protein n=1 Tax=Pseudomaricurvus albidus TaxID=2842452 RepID=UPI001C0C23A8|nr:DsbE family thiol:disulfide interchange protein [Aestuariicella albida]MBU3069967.1 DsbE family thiol:disulfide interchange protein [Aestuariicella albida]
MSRLKLFIPLMIFVVLAVFFWRGLSLDPTDMPSALIDRPMPAFSLPTVNDATRVVSEGDLKGEVTLLNVWATWCISCRVEHPYLVELAAQGVKIVGVNYKDDVQEAQKWLKNLHNPYVYSIVDADGRLGIDLGVFGAPETYVLDRQGVIRYKHVGVIDDKVWTEEIKPIVDALKKG